MAPPEAPMIEPQHGVAPAELFVIVDNEVDVALTVEVFVLAAGVRVTVDVFPDAVLVLKTVDTDAGSVVVRVMVVSADRTIVEVCVEAVTMEVLVTNLYEVEIVWASTSVEIEVVVFSFVTVFPAKDSVTNDVT